MDYACTVILGILRRQIDLIFKSADNNLGMFESSLMSYDEYKDVYILLSAKHKELTESVSQYENERFAKRFEPRSIEETEVKDG